MLEGPSLLRLIDGIAEHTVNGNISWQRKSSTSGGAGLADSINRMLSASLNQPKIFAAHAGEALYEIASSNGYGGAPFEFRVWELKDGALRPIGVSRSSTNLSDSVQLRVNTALQNLFAVVDRSTETSEEIVDRLLGGLD
jgi:hypothetical protein